LTGRNVRLSNLLISSGQGQGQGWTFEVKAKATKHTADIFLFTVRLTA